MSGRRPKITTDQATTWLSQIESGAAIATVARDAGVQARTVTKHVALAGKRREETEARRAVLIQAVAAHQVDLLGAAIVLRRGLRLPPPRALGTPSGHEELLRAAVLDHLGRSTRRALERWNDVVHNYDKAGDALQERLAAETAVEAGRFSANPPGLRSAAEAGLWGTDIDSLPAAFSEDRLSLGAFGVAACSPEADGLVAETEAAPYRALLSNAKSWPEYQVLRDRFDAIVRLRDELAEELDAVQLRHHLQGRCRFCPTP